MTPEALRTLANTVCWYCAGEGKLASCAKDFYGTIFPSSRPCPECNGRGVFPLKPRPPAR